MSDNQLFHIGVKGLIKNSHGEYLCVKSPQGFMDVPGGRIMSGETWKDTLWRELREELCVPSDAYTTADTVISLPTNRLTQRDPEVGLFILLCHCELISDTTPILLNEENTEYSWVTARELYEKVLILQFLKFEEIFS